MFKKIPLIIFLFLIAHFSNAQNYTINGKITDEQSGETLIGATIQIQGVTKSQVISNEYGFYSVTLPKGTYTFKISFLQYTEKEMEINLIENKTINIALRNKGYENKSDIIVVKARKKDAGISKSQMGVEKINVADISRLPVIFGEKDILKTIQLLPGIKSAGEGNSGFFVRGGSADQNLILLDEAPVYNASHLLGFFSTFNSDAIKDVTVIKGNTPAQYGGRLSSVLDIKMNEGNNKEFHATGGLGLISSRLSLEGPIQKEKSSFLLSGRRTYADQFLKLSDKYKDNVLYFYDFNAKANYYINKNNRLYLSGYFGRDNLKFGNQFGIDWGNKTATLRWNSIISPKLFSNTSLINSDYDYKIKINGGNVDFNINSNIRDYNLKQDFQLYYNAKNTIKFGANSIYHTITPSRFQGDISNENIATKSKRNGLENAIYIQNSYAANNKLNMDYGLRFSTYTLIGGTYSIFYNGIKKDSFGLGKNKAGKTYNNLEPRLAFSYNLNEKTNFKLAYSRNVQNLHLLSNSTSTNPTDSWVGNSYNIKPELADQVAFGYFKNFTNREIRYDLQIETYYKTMQNQVDYKNGADLFSVPDVESELLYGKGRAYGIEFYLKKKTGKMTGWFSYTLSKSERLIEGINNNKWYNAKQDRTHDFSLVGTYTLTPKWTLSGIFVYYTGNAVTFPSGKYSIAGNTIFLYTERNGYRMPSYNRLDLGATYEKKKTGRRWQGSWNFSVYNAYGKENAYAINFQDDEKDATKTVAVRTALFKWVPSITYNFKF
jgi:hypothetical protein